MYSGGRVWHPIRPQRVEYAHDDNYHVVLWYESGARDKRVGPPCSLPFSGGASLDSESVRNGLIAYLCVDDAGGADWVR